MDERRYYGLDALRGGMMMLGIVLHAGGFYLTSPPPTMPIVMDHNTSYVFDLLFHFIHSFRMPAFFVLAGFFASLLVEKRGTWGALKNRAARIGGPLVAGIVTVVPLTIVLALDFMLSVRFGTHDVIPDKGQLETLVREMAAAGFPTDEPSIGHLWFLYYLCFFYLLIPVCRALVRASQRIEQPLRRFLLSPYSLVAFGLYAALTLWPFRGAQVHEGFLYLKPHIPSLVYYGSFFVLGYLFHYYRDFVQSLARGVKTYALLSAVLFPLSLFMSHLEHTAAPEQLAGTHLAAVVAHGLCTWALIYLFIGCALRFFDRASPWTLYVSQSSYWVFLIHLPLVCFAGWWLVPYDLPAILKFTIVTAFTTVISFATYHYWVQGTWMSVFLNGRRFHLDWPWAAAMPEDTKPSHA